jgi:glutaredoxin
VKEFLSQRGIAHTSRDVSSDPAAMEELGKLGYMTTPVTTIDGQIVVGFDQKRLAALLGAN